MNEAEKAKLQRRFDALMASDLDAIHRELNASANLCNTLKEDFRIALKRMVDNGTQAPDRRDVVRCFGSLLDALTATMRSAAIEICKAFGEPLNPFLQEKTGDRNLTTHQRIYNVYRLMADFLPKSPLARIPDERWNELHRALETRNRVIHPTRAGDLELSDAQIKTVIGIGYDFYDDYRHFTQWFSQKEQKMLWELPGTRKRYLAKTGRNQPCPCGSNRKYKNCCALSAV
jgi:hypothetical protein